MGTYHKYIVIANPRPEHVEELTADFRRSLNDELNKHYETEDYDLMPLITDGNLVQGSCSFHRWTAMFALKNAGPTCCYGAWDDLDWDKYGCYCDDPIILHIGDDNDPEVITPNRAGGSSF